MASPEQNGRAAARARRAAQIQGKSQGKSALRSGSGGPSAPSRSPAPPTRPAAAASASREGGDARTASKVRREALAGRGKAALSRPERTRSDAPDQGPGAAPPSAPHHEASPDLAAAAHDAPETRAPAPSATPSRRPATPAKAPNMSQGRMLSQARRRAISTAGKKGTETHKGGSACAQVARQLNPDISGRDLSKAVREERARNGRSGAPRSAPTGRRRPDRAASDATTGTALGPGGRETGAEVGLCRDVTGTRYMAGEVFDRFCQGEPPRAPRKVGDMRTLHGRTVTGTRTSVTGAAPVTGAEAGRCRSVTGDEYLGGEHFAAVCDTVPAAQPVVTGQTRTQRGQTVSGPRMHNGGRVTGTEAGADRALTGTPYGGGNDTLSRSAAPSRPAGSGRDITGLQPGVTGLTGAARGACDAITGTPYMGAGQATEACGGAAPSAITAGTRPGVTGARGGGATISGIFSRGAGKVTGTEDRGSEPSRPRPTGPMPAMAMAFKKTPPAAPEPAPAPAPVSIEFAAPPARQAPAAATGETAAPAEPAASAVPPVPDDPRPRITGEGMDKGPRITGDDWDRGDRVTGTEGHSASARNPSWRGSAPSRQPQRAASADRSATARASDFLVTGSSGNTEKGAMVTVSGGARG